MASKLFNTQKYSIIRNCENAFPHSLAKLIAHDRPALYGNSPFIKGNARTHEDGAIVAERYPPTFVYYYPDVAEGTAIYYEFSAILYCQGRV